MCTSAQSRSPTRFSPALRSSSPVGSPDPLLVLGPLAAHYGWQWDDWDLLARGTLAGHLLECGSQVSGGYFADPGFKDVAGTGEDIGFPIAEVDARRRLAITKADGTGGLVYARTVKEQILYEMHDPQAYLTPDVAVDIRGVDIEEIWVGTG